MWWEFPCPILRVNEVEKDAVTSEHLSNLISL